MYEVPRVYNIGQSTVASCRRTSCEIMLHHKIKDPKDAYKLPGQTRMEANGMMDSDFPICAKEVVIQQIHQSDQSRVLVVSALVLNRWAQKGVTHNRLRVDP